MCKNHGIQHYPLELRDVAHRIVADSRSSVSEDDKAEIVGLLLRQATGSGLIEYLDTLPKDGFRVKMHVKVLAYMARTSEEAVQLMTRLAEKTDDDDPPF